MKPETVHLIRGSCHGTVACGVGISSPGLVFKVTGCKGKVTCKNCLRIDSPKKRRENSSRPLKIHFIPEFGSIYSVCGLRPGPKQQTRDPESATCGNCLKAIVALAKEPTRKVHYHQKSTFGYYKEIPCGIWSECSATEVKDDVTCNTCRRILGLEIPEKDLSVDES